MTNTDLIIALLNRGDLDDALDAIVDNADLLTVSDADAIMAAALTIDPTASFSAAEVRSAIRDNTEHDLIG